MYECIIINRISSQRQDEGYSLPQQSKLNKSYAKQLGCKVLKEFNIIESARTSEKRDDFYEAMNFIKKHKNVTHIIVEKTDRLTRNFQDQVFVYDLVTKYEITLVFSKENQIINKDSPSNTKLMFDIRTVLAKNYIDNLSEEVKKGQRGMLDEGKWPGGSCPMGYKKINKLLVPEPTTAHYVKRAYELYSTGAYSIRLLKKKLDDEGFRSFNNKPLTKSNYYNLLTNPIYHGYIRWNKQLYSGIHEPILEKLLFDKVANMLKRTKNGLVIPTFTKHDFTYRGVIQCGECGSKITAEEKTKQNKGNGKVHRWVYYHCTHFKPCTQKGCVREEIIENEVINLLSKINLGTETTKWLKARLKENHKEEIQFRNTSLDALNQRQKLVQEHLDKVYDDKIDGVIDEGTYNRKREQYLIEQSLVLDQIEKHTIADRKYVDFGSLLLDLANKAVDVYKVRKIDEKRTVLKIIFSNLLLRNKKIEFSFNPIFDGVFQYSKTKNVLRDLDSNQNTILQRDVSCH